MVLSSYGTDDQGQIIDEHGYQYPVTDREKPVIDDFYSNSQQWILVPDLMLGFGDGQNRRDIRRGWIAITPILNKGKPVAVFTNGTVISGAPVDPFQQEQLALYTSLVGQIWARKQSEQLLRDSEAKYRALVEGIDAVITIFDVDGNLFFANQQAIQTLGWQDLDPVGKPMETLFSAPIAHIQRRVIRQIGQSGETIIRDVPGLIPAENRWFRFICQPIMDPGGTVVRRVLISAVDVTLIKNTEQALFSQTVELEKRVAERTAELMQTQKRLEAIFNHSGDGIVLIDVDQRIQQGNYMFEQMFQVAPENYQGWPLRQLVHPDDGLFLDERVHNVADKHEAQRFEIRAQTPLGTVFNIEINLSPVNRSEQAVDYLVAIISDISVRKAADQAIKHALEQAEELSELRARFVSTASHEFRTPLATIMASAETLEAYRARMTDEEIAQRLAKIQYQGNRMRGIIDEVLLLSRMQSGRVAFEPVKLDLDAFCRDVISDFENRPDIDHQIHYTCSPQPLPVQIDSKLLQPALSNLITNAIKYSPLNKQVYITVASDNDSVTIQIRDSGIGIPTADLEHLFESFHRASNVGGIPGTGLGLVITKQSIELHGGAIQVSSTVGQGTTFTVRLPR